MAKPMNKPKDMVKITQRAAQELRAIQVANARDETHVLRIEIEGEGFGLWLGPEQEGDTVVGSEDSIWLRATPDLTRYLRRTSVIIDCVDYEDSQRLIVYCEGEPPPQMPNAGKERPGTTKAAPARQGTPAARARPGRPAAPRGQRPSKAPKK